MKWFAAAFVLSLLFAASPIIAVMLPKAWVAWVLRMDEQYVINLPWLIFTTIPIGVTAAAIVVASAAWYYFWPR